MRRAVEEGRDIEPPCIRGMNGPDLDQLFQNTLRTGVPSHTQSTERAVKLTTEPVTAVTGPERQDSHTLNKRASRRKMQIEKSGSQP